MIPEIKFSDLMKMAENALPITLYRNEYTSVEDIELALATAALLRCGAEMIIIYTPTNQVNFDSRKEGLTTKLTFMSAPGEKFYIEDSFSTYSIIIRHEY